MSAEKTSKNKIYTFNRSKNQSVKFNLYGEPLLPFWKKITFNFLLKLYLRKVLHRWYTWTSFSLTKTLGCKAIICSPYMQCINNLAEGLIQADECIDVLDNYNSLLIYYKNNSLLKRKYQNTFELLLFLYNNHERR